MQLERIVDKGQLGTLATISDDNVAEQLLAIATDTSDANATQRAADYIIGSLLAPDQIQSITGGSLAGPTRSKRGELSPIIWTPAARATAIHRRSFRAHHG